MNDETKDLISVEEFLQEVWKVEHIKIHIEIPKDKIIMLPHYPYTTPAPGSMTCDEFLDQRIDPIIKNHVYEWKGTTSLIFE